MINNLPWYVPFTILVVNLIFWIYWTTGLSIALRKLKKPNPMRTVGIVGMVLIAWLALQGMLAYSGFYREVDRVPPPFLYGLIPPLMMIFLSLIWSPIRNVLDEIPLSNMTYIHTVRLAVELVVWSLYLHQTTPRLITFGGLNYDIAIGITAPFIGYLCFTKKILSPKVALVWHVIGLLFLINVSTLFIFSAPSPFQIFKGEYANIGFFYFPFIWAPTHGVPTVILTHCIVVRRLWRIVKSNEQV